MKAKTRVATILLVVLSVLSFSTAAFASFTPPPGVTVTPGGENCNGIIPTPGSQNTVKSLTGLTVDSAGTHAQYTIAYPVDPADVGDTFQIVDCVLSGSGSDLSKYTVEDEATFDGVVNSTSFNLTFQVTIPASTPVGTRICNVAKTTEGPSAPSASNRKAGPACFIVGGDVRVLKLSTTAPNDTAHPIAGATFTVWDCNNTAGNNSTLQPIIVLPTPSSGNIYSATLGGGGVVHATAGVVSFAGPSGSSCKITETDPPSGYELPATVTQTVTIPVGTGGATVYKFLDPPSPGSVHIHKNAPASQQSTVFNFDITCTSPSHTYQTSITGTGDSTVTDIPAGSSCTVTETNAPSVDNVVINPSGAFTVASGQTVDVTVTNSLKPGSLTVTKVAPESAVYSFSVSCTNDASSPYTFDITGSASHTINNIPAGSQCTVTETDPGSAYNAPGYSPSATVTILANDTVTVTVTNTLKSGGLTVTKAAPAGSDEVFSFTVTCSGDANSPYTFDITGSASHNITGIPAGSSCTVVETTPGSDFNTPAYSPSATVLTEANVTKEITVTNTLKTGDLTITKVAPSGSTTEYNFDVTCTNPHTSPVGPYTASITGSGSDTINNIPAGSTCTVAEQNPGSTYNAPGYSPSDTVLVTGGQTVTVTVTNSLKPGSLTITKVAPAGVTDTFTFNIDCGGESTYQLQITGSGSATQDGIPAGSVCTITEVLPAGYAQPAFAPSNHVTVGAAQNVTVTATNTLLPLGISIVKTANPISGGPGDPVTYTYVVKNIGQVDLINVSVNDDKLGHVGDIASLLVGESKTLTFNTTMPNSAGALVNVGTAVGHDRFGRSTSAHDDATVTVVLAVRLLPKTGSDMRLPMETGFALLGIGFAFIGLARKRQSAAAAPIQSDEN
jgi:uncharacterized protein DUF5979